MDYMTLPAAAHMRLQEHVRERMYTALTSPLPDKLVPSNFWADRTGEVSKSEIDNYTTFLDKIGDYQWRHQPLEEDEVKKLTAYLRQNDSATLLQVEYYADWIIDRLLATVEMLSAHQLQQSQVEG